MTDIKAVVFDWGGTLTPWHAVDTREPWVAFARGFGTMACAQNNLAGQLLELEDRLWASSREEHRSADLLRALDEAGITDSPARRAGLDAYFEWWTPHGITRPDAGPGLEALRARGLRTGVLSNTIWSRETHRAIFERDGVLNLIDADLYTSEVPWTKPHPEVFTEICRRLDVAPQETVFVGDRRHEDVWGPHQVGMRAILVQHDGFGDGAHVPSDEEPDAVVTDLGEIDGIIASWLAG